MVFRALSTEDIVSYSASTAAMAKAGEWQQALHLLHQVQVNLGMWELVQSHHLFVCTCKFAFVVHIFLQLHQSMGVTCIPL